ncbi:hypothetical protein BD289DRAFT_451588 [Coniella lustricola]|uniref:Uncharacterized protein n=1 Tax=Coniella lustricola TaxID=2025994 RepID=A0A2T3AEF3_9PEZI|nr:hypothetical protein BD289DRAFT_451588 [Coniella lustricola]
MSDRSTALPTAWHGADIVEPGGSSPNRKESAWTLTRAAGIEWTHSVSDVDSRPVSAPDTGLQADGSSHWLGDTRPNPVTCAISFDPVTRELQLRLRIVVHFHSMHIGATSLFLYVSADKIQSLALAPPGYANFETAERSGLRSRLGRNPLCLFAELNSPAQLVVPTWPLVPGNRAHGITFEAVTELAQQTKFCLWLEDDQERKPADPSFVLTKDRLHNLCREVNSAKCQIKSVETQIKGLYGGKGGCLVSQAELLRGYTNNPPAYDEAQSGQLSTDTASKTDTHTSKTKKRRLSDADGSAIAAATLKDILRSVVSEQFGQFETRIQALVDDRFKMQEAKLEKRFDELEQKLGGSYSKVDEHVSAQYAKYQKRCDDLEGDLQDLSSQIDDRVWLEVDELKTNIHEEFDDLRTETEDLVRQEVRTAANGIIRHLNNVEVNVIGGKLDFEPVAE